MHPRERRTTRRTFVASSGGALFALLGGDTLLDAARALASGSGAPIGPGGIPLARRNFPVTLPISHDNVAIASGESPEKGPLEVFNWSAYINPAVVKDFSKIYGAKVNITTFENEEEALSKLTSGQVHFDVWFATVDYLSRAVAGKLIQPLNHSYLPNLKNVWPSLANPFYDVGSRYTVPYTIYTTGITWRKDKLAKGPASYANPYDIFWEAGSKLKGKTAILDDQREALAMALLRRHITDVNSEDPKLIQRAGADLSQLTKSLNVKTNVTDYQDVPAGSTWLSQAWSGDMAAAPQYMPKGVPVSVIGYWRPDKNAVVGSDMITILRGAKNPVLAHHFLNFILDDKRGLENLSWLGYMPPLTSITADKVIAGGYIPKSLSSTVVRPSDFDHGVSLMPLTTQAQATWQDAWSTFKAGG